MVNFAQPVAIAVAARCDFATVARFPSNHKDNMQRSTNHYLIWSGGAAVAAALLHIAAIFGGEAWYRLIGAPEGIIRMAARGHCLPVVVCVMAALLLFACAGFAFSGAGLIRRPPLLRTSLVLITTGLLLHGLAFIPLVLYSPEMMMPFYDGQGINANLIIISLICALAGVGYALGTRQAWRANAG